jgi:hypothetical protein
VCRVLLAGVAVFFACTPARNEQQFRLRVALVGPLKPLEPAGEPSASDYAKGWVFEPLLRAAGDGSPVAVLAGQFRFLTPARMAMRIREGARFSDGSPVTADEIRSSLRHAGIEVREQGSELLVESPSGSAIESLLRHEPIFKRTGERYVGSGPFQVVSTDAERMLLRRNAPVPGKIAEVLLLGFPTARDPFARTLAGDADLLIVTDPKQLEFFQGIPRLRVVRGHGTSAIAVAMGLRRLSRSERRALAASLPVARLSQLVFGEECPPFAASRTDGSLASIARLLEIAVLPEDLQLEHMGLAIARALGSRAKGIRAISVAEAFDLFRSQDFDLMMLRPVVWPPSSAALIWASDSPYNESGYSNPKVDAALKAADWGRALEELRYDPPVVFICRPERLAVVDSRIKNARVDGYDYLETLPDWEVAE